MSKPAQSALKSVSERATFLLDEEDSHPLAKSEAELIVVASVPPEVPQRYRKLSQSGLMIEVKESEDNFDFHLASE